MKKEQEIEKIILQQIFSRGYATRPELISLTGTRAATIFGAVDRLKSAGVICEPSRSGQKTGRKAPQLSFSPDYMYFLGIDFQVHGTVGVLTDMSGNILLKKEMKTNERKSLSACQGEIIELIQSLKSESGDKWAKLGGVGFADPGLVDIRHGVSLRAVNIPCWENFATGSWLQQETGVPSGVWPECLVKTFMEYKSRHFPADASLFHLALGNGIGGGFIKDGKCFIGDTNQAMEIGHIVIEPNGPLCRCGNRGCLEAVAGELEIRRRVQEALDNGVETSLDMEDFTLARLASLAQSDKAARIIATQVCESIGKALANVVTLLNPSIIVMSGELTAMGDLLLASLRNILNLSCFPGAVKDLKLEISSAVPEDTARGAALMMCGKILELQ